MNTPALKNQLIKNGYTLVEKCVSFNPNKKRRMLALRISNAIYREVFFWYFSPIIRRNELKHMCDRPFWILIQDEVEDQEQEDKFYDAIILINTKQ